MIRMNMKTPINLNPFNVDRLERTFAVFQSDTPNRKDSAFKLNCDLPLNTPAKAKVITIVAAAPIRQKIRGRGGVNGSK